MLLNLYSIIFSVSIQLEIFFAFCTRKFRNCATSKYNVNKFVSYMYVHMFVVVHPSYKLICTRIFCLQKFPYSNNTPAATRSLLRCHLQQPGRLSRSEPVPMAAPVTRQCTRTRLPRRLLPLFPLLS